MSLKDHLIARIRETGPMTIADYMADCLLHPRMGYYTTRDPFGVAGDFTTAPEVSQMFGEVLGLCLAQAWLDQGAPPRVTLAELGPGRGTLMADMLRATKAVSGFHDATTIVLVEASEHLRAQQRRTLSAFDICFARDASEMPERPLYVVANEFFDALPIRQFQRDGAGWRERQVGLEGETLTMGLGPRQQQPALRDRLVDTRDGDVVEYAPALAPITDALTGRIRDWGGAGLVIDYGDWHSLGETLQAVRGHAFVDVLEDPGNCDLTAHVDFAALARAARCRHSRLTPQGVFLERLSITQRAQSLAHALGGEALSAHVAAHRRLTHPDEMGQLFKVLGFFPDGGPPPAGLDV